MTDDATDVTDLAAAADVTGPSQWASAPRVFVAADPTVDVGAAVEELAGPEPDETEQQPATTAPTAPAIDLEQIERDLEGVAMALARLDDGTYWTDEVTGEPLADELLVADPVARRNR